MATRQEILLTLRDVVRRIYDHRRDATAGLSRVSREEKSGVAELVILLDRIRQAEPFPDFGSEQEETLRELAELAPDEARDRLRTWVENFAPLPPPPAPATAPLSPHPNGIPLTSPGNTRMLMNLHHFHTRLTRARLRLLREQDPYDQAAYKTARNNWHLAYAAYKPRLTTDRITATPVQNEEMLGLVTNLKTVDGPGFPTLLKSAADLVREYIFGPDTFVV
ncbi:hypothetical protein [Neolewinella antarctica]|uniref:Uncharacterized protein n=1 Tax=Neolewinella antarctica TaxID=442734 RepID=A0ABX0XGI1_9BACT|nr:hypothetical protein [Neolewinella antarctica]NJC28425.1 hypothetical protein [Neolewinella antarctica]